ncbi:helix-turn-helix domain-containing protein [Streptomyces sp. NPDC006172]|uniref:helix-turn-helix domain-containing protein n=1 Tax=Streptomyces sp. NPDC006172 TaxID=3154470 RepID=UPI00341022DA
MPTHHDVEEFAALLRRLKDRTDRSYGSLARRVNMNTSTLHRYCAGEAVPQDFAPVERLAAFCAATPQERLELHRLWLSAVAARQRPRTADAPEAEQAPEPKQAPEQLPEPEPAPEQLPELEQASEPEQAPAPTPEANVSAHDRAPVEETSPAEQPGSGPAPGPAPHEDAPAARPWYRTRRALVSAAVTCALLAAAGGVSALSDHGSSAADASPSAVPRTTSAGAHHRATKPSAASPSPSGSPASRGARQKAPSPSATSGSHSPTGQPATGALPLTWSVDSLVWDKGCDHDYVIDKPPAQVPPPPMQQDAGVWAAKQGAVHGRQTKVQISVQGRSSAAVILHALRVRVVSRGTPITGNAYSMNQGCGSDITPRRFAVNLDADRPVARPEDGADTGVTVPAVRFPYRVSVEDPEVLLVDGTTQAHDARWYLELDWSSQGRTGTIRIDDHGRPFHTTGIKGMPHYWYGTNDADERAWVPYDSQ